MLAYCIRWTVLGAVLACAGCGLIADKDQIVVARMDGETYTRGDLRAALRAMKDEERPIITTRGDLERFLRDHLDLKIRESLAMELRAEGKIDVPREQAAARYFAENPDQAAIPRLTDPGALGITAEQLRALKADVEYEIDVMRDKLLREVALQYVAAQAYHEGLITISEHDYERAYAVHRDNLRSLEYIDFVGLRFPAAIPNAVILASDIRRRIDAGDAFDDIVEEFAARNPAFVLASRFENNPSSGTFRTFWLTAAGVEEGDIVGPVFIPAYSLIDGEGQRVDMPEAYLVLRVEEHEPPTELSLEEAKPLLSQLILLRKATEWLRDEHNVEFYDNKLWDPGMYGEQEVRF
jgi:hypothetical protein